MWAAVDAGGRPLDAVALNAGIGVNGDFTRDIPLEDDLELIAVNVTALQPGPTETEFFDRAGMDGTKVADADKDDPAEVARDGFEALMAGKDHVIAGSVKNKAQVAGGKLMPEKARAAVHAAQVKPEQDD